MNGIARIFGISRRYEVFGPQGGLSTTVRLPEGFRTETDKCPMVILMHGFMARKEMAPVSYIAKSLAKAGIASIAFDFNAHGKSEGKFIGMTISNEIADARAVFEYVCALPYVTKIGLLGHSQGGVVAGMLAGQLEGHPRRPACIVQMAPAAVLKDDAIAGTCMGFKYNPSNPPEYVNVMMHKLGRNFILEAQKLPVYEVSSKYGGDVCIIHGSGDRIVPVSYSERYKETYSSCELHVLENEGHFFRTRKDEISGTVTDFYRKRLQ